MAHRETTCLCLCELRLGRALPHDCHQMPRVAGPPHCLHVQLPLLHKMCNAELSGSNSKPPPQAK